MSHKISSKASFMRPNGIRYFKRSLKETFVKLGSEMFTDYTNITKDWSDLSKPVWSGKIKTSGDPAITITANGEIFGYVEEGTKPHDIYPKEKKALRFSTTGQNVIFAKHVKHPGYKGSHQLPKLHKKWQMKITKTLKKELANTKARKYG